MCTFARHACQLPRITHSFLLQQLMNVLEKDELSGIISWFSNGKGFVILDRKGVENVIMPRYFNLGEQGKFSSFSRRLRRWGFHIERCGGGGGVDHAHENIKSSCFHPMFIRGRPELCERMIALPQARSNKTSQQTDKKRRGATSMAMDGATGDDKNSSSLLLVGGGFPPLRSTSQEMSSPKRTKLVHTDPSSMAACQQQESASTTSVRTLKHPVSTNKVVPSTSQHHSSCYGVEEIFARTHSSPTRTLQHQKPMSSNSSPLLLRHSSGVSTSPSSRHLDGNQISRSYQAPIPMHDALMQSRIVMSQAGRGRNEANFVNYMFPTTTTSSRMIPALTTIQQNGPGLFVDNYAEETYLLRQREEAAAAIHFCTLDEKKNQQMRNQVSTLYRWHPSLSLSTSIVGEEGRRSLRQEEQEQEQCLFKNHQHLLRRRGEMLVAHTTSTNARNEGGFANSSRTSDDDDESLVQALMEMRSHANSK